jgi:hypothetical protein
VGTIATGRSFRSFVAFENIQSNMRLCINAREDCRACLKDTMYHGNIEIITIIKYFISSNMRFFS